MPDISMCDGNGCQRKDECYRHTATPEELQSIFVQSPVREDGTCEYYWDNKEDKRESDT